MEQDVLHEGVDDIKHPGQYDPVSLLKIGYYPPKLLDHNDPFTIEADAQQDAE